MLVQSWGKYLKNAHHIAVQEDWKITDFHLGMSTIFELLKAEHKNLWLNTDSELNKLFLLEFWVAGMVKYKHFIAWSLPLPALPKLLVSCLIHHNVQGPLKGACGWFRTHAIYCNPVMQTVKEGSPRRCKRPSHTSLHSLPRHRTTHTTSQDKPFSQETFHMKKT